MAAASSNAVAGEASRRRHFAYLDGLRGVAAIAVVWLHAADVFELAWVPIHAGLAVDFFFCLSGFVIAYAYDERLCRDMRFGDFLARRIIRLYPLILFGVGLGLSLKLAQGAPGSAASVDALTAALLIPIGLVDGRVAYPTNYPMWSLFFEITMSAAYGLLAKRLDLRAIVLTSLFAGIALGAMVLLAGQVTGFGFKGIPQFLIGFVRVSYPFLMGVALYRFKLHEGRGLPPWLVTLIVSAILLAPIGEAGWFEATAAIVLLPIIVALGARVRPGRWDAAWSKLGELSYPLYLVHLPVLVYVASVAPHSLQMAMTACFVAVIASVGVLKYYDEPVRNWFTRLAQSKARTASLA